MSQYGLIYRVEFNDMEGGVTTTCDIIDTSVVVGDSDPVTIVPLRPAATPLIISTVNNDRDKFQPIRPKQAQIQFLSDRSQSLDISTFSDAPDNNFLVQIATVFETLFVGYLMLTDMEQSFQPDPIVVTMIASDHLALLKDIPLVDENGLNPQGKYTIAKVLSMCLAQTGSSLAINVINNLRHGSGTFDLFVNFNATGNIIEAVPTKYFYPGQTLVVSGTASNDGTIHILSVAQGAFTLSSAVETLVNESVVAHFVDQSTEGHFYDKVYIDALTAEDQVGLSISCYDTIVRILGEDCYLTQWRGGWWIMRVDEFDGNPIYVGRFSTAGVFLGMDSPTAFDMSVGVNEDRVFALADAIQSSERKNKTVKETFSYETPQELICNNDFERGDLISTVSNAEKHYELDCWQAFQEDFGGAAGGLIAATSTIYVRRDFFNDQETKRCLVFEDNSVPSNLVISRPVDMLVADKFNITISRRVSVDQGGSADYTERIGRVRLYGNDGTFYTLHGGVTTDPIPRWVACTEDFNTSQQAISYQGNTASDETDTISTTVEAPPLPVSGYIRVILSQSGLYGNSADTYHEPPTLEYLPFINGSYAKFNAQTSQVDSTVTGWNAKREESVGLSDSPRPSLKNSMFIPVKLAAVLYGPASVVFGGTAFAIAGDQRSIFLAGMHIFIDSASNTGYQTVISTTYHVIGDTTDIFTNGTTTVVTESATIYAAAYFLTTQFYTSAQFALGSPPDDSYLHPYGYIQAFSIWNQYNIAYRIFQGTVKGISDEHPDLLHKFTLSDSDPNTNNRYFMLISYSSDEKTGLWSAVFVEVYNTVTGKVYSDTFTFKYLQ